MGKYELARFESADALAAAAAEGWMAQLLPNGSAGFAVALPGGRIAGRLFSAVAQLPDSPELLRKAHFFWGDERCVLPSDPESNFGLAEKALLTPLGIPTASVHRVRGELAPADAAAEAEEELRRYLTAERAGQPVLDLVLLGMGEDGHVASLFPGEPEEAMHSPALYRGVVGPKPPPNRVTLGYGVIAAARQVWVLASGAGKEAALLRSLDAKGTTPLARVLALRAHTRICTDLPV